jgi:hypothetical protein
MVFGKKPVHWQGSAVGNVSSAALSDSIGKSIAFAWLPATVAFDLFRSNTWCVESRPLSPLSHCMTRVWQVPWDSHHGTSTMGLGTSRPRRELGLKVRRDSHGASGTSHGTVNSASSKKFASSMNYAFFLINLGIIHTILLDSSIHSQRW